MVIILDVHQCSIYATVMEDKGDIIFQRNIKNNMGIINGLLSIYRYRDIVEESSKSGKYFSEEVLKLKY